MYSTKIHLEGYPLHCAINASRRQDCDRDQCERGLSNIMTACMIEHLEGGGEGTYVMYQCLYINYQVRIAISDSINTYNQWRI